MARSYTRRINLYINGMRVRNNIKSINARLIHLRRTIRTVEVGSRQYIRQMSQIRQLDAIIRNHNNQLKATHINLASLKGLANAFNKYWPMIMGSIGIFAGFGMAARRAAQDFAEFEDQIADVMKVTGLTRDEVVRLNERFKEMDTRTAQESLMELAWVAGKLGIEAVEDIEGFVNAADKITVALAKDLGGNAEEAVRQIGKLTQIFEIRDVYGVEESMLKAASAINELGMASTAQEKDIINFVYRVGGIAPTAGVSMDAVLGLGAALDILGQRAQVSATAYSRVMTTLVRDTETMARLAGMSIADWTELIEKDANEAMLQLFESIRGAEGGFTGMIDALGEAGLEGQRLTQVLGVLIRNTDLVREQQELASKAFGEGDSVLKEFNIKNYNAQAILEKKQKDLANLRRELGERLIPVYTGVLSVQERWLKSIVAIVEWIYENRNTLLSLIMVIGSYQIALKLLKATQAKVIISFKALKAAVYGLQVAFYRATGQIYAMKRAMVKLRALSLKNPWIVLGAAIAAAGVAIWRFTRNTKDAGDVLEESWAKINREATKDVEHHTLKLDLLIDRLKKTVAGSDRRKGVLEEIKKEYPEYLEYLDAEKASLDEIIDAYDQYVEAQFQQARQKQMIEEYHNLEEEVSDLNEEINRIWEEGDFGIDTPFGTIFRWRPADLRKIAGLEELRMETKNAMRDIRATLEGENIAKEWGDEIGDMVQEANRLEKSLEGPVEIWEHLGGRKARRMEGVEFEGEFIPFDDEQAIQKLKERYEELKEAIQKAMDAAREEDPDRDRSPTPLGPDAADFSEQAELWEKYHLKIKYMQGELVGGWEEFQQRLSQIELKYMRGRHSQLDEDSEKRAQSANQIKDKEIEILRERNDFQEKLAETAMDDLIKTERKAHQERLEEHRLWNYVEGKVKEDLSKKEKEVLEMLEKEFQENISEIRLEYIKDYFEDKEEAHKYEINQTEKQYYKELRAIGDNEEKKAELKREYDEKIRKENIEFYEEWINELIDILSGEEVENIIKAGDLLSDEEKDKFISMINEIKEKRDDLTKDDEDDDPDGPHKLSRRLHFDIFGFRDDDWERFFENLDIAKGKFEDMELSWRDWVDMAHMGLMAISHGISDMHQIASNKEEKRIREFERSQQQQLDALQERYEAGLKSEDFYNYQREKLEEKLEQKKAEFALKNAKRERAVATFQAIINTAAAVVKALKTSRILAGIIAAAGAVQVAKIRSQPLPEVHGAEEGGGIMDVIRAQDGKKYKAKKDPNKRGFINKPTVLTGEENKPEYVVPEEGVNNPSLRPIIDMIEMARISGNLPTLNMDSVMPVVQGKQAGGSIQQTEAERQAAAGNQQPATDTSMQDLVKEANNILKENKEVMDKLNRQLEHPIEANVSLTGRKGFYEQDEKFKQLKRNVYF